jgi:hypothetical protein
MDFEPGRLRRHLWGLFACYPLMPLAFVCGFGIRNNSPSLVVCAVFYALLLWNLAGCARRAPAGRIAFGAAFLTVLLHLVFVARLVQSYNDITANKNLEYLLLCIPVVVAAVGAAAAQLAQALGFRLAALCLLGGAALSGATPPFILLGGTFPVYMQGQEWIAVAVFALQGLLIAVLAAKLKSDNDADLEGVGLSPR